MASKSIIQIAKEARLSVHKQVGRGLWANIDGRTKCGTTVHYDNWYRLSYAWKNVTCRKCLRAKKSTDAD